MNAASYYPGYIKLIRLECVKHMTKAQRDMSIAIRKHEGYPDSILIRDFTGTISVSNIVESWEYILDQNMINESTRGVINNITGCALEMNLKSFETLISFLKKHAVLRKIKLAVICDNPSTIIFPALGETKEPELKIKPFSTMSAATTWVMAG